MGCYKREKERERSVRSKEQGARSKEQEGGSKKEETKEGERGRECWGKGISKKWRERTKEYNGERSRGRNRGELQ